MDEPPEIALLDAPPVADEPTDYDWAHRICYLRLLDADTAGADWREVARVVMKLDPDNDPDRVHAVWQSHLRRAKWMTTHGYRAYLGAASAVRRSKRAFPVASCRPPPLPGEAMWFLGR